MFNISTLSLKANDYSNPNYLGSRFRKKRFQFFEQKLALLKKPVSIVDIGGTIRFWVDEQYHKKDVSITVVNLRKEDSPYTNITAIAGDACNLSMFADHTFDIAFSNSLIEHLYTQANQLKMASEAMRIARYHFVQTPNRYFPIEPHFKFPLFQFLPSSVKILLQTKTKLINGTRYDRAYAEEIVREIRLLSRREMEAYFPESDVYVERFLGFSKSFIMHNLPS